MSQISAFDIVSSNVVGRPEQEKEYKSYRTLESYHVEMNMSGKYLKKLLIMKPNMFKSFCDLIKLMCVCICAYIKNIYVAHIYVDIRERHNVRDELSDKIFEFINVETNLQIQS